MSFKFIFDQALWCSTFVFVDYCWKGQFVTWPNKRCYGAKLLRTFAPNFSNIDFFLEILPLKDDELVMSEM